MRHPDTGACVQIPNNHHKKTISPSTFLFKSMLSQAGVTKKQFAEAFFGK